MKIAYIGNFEPEYSTENDVRKAFEHLGHEVYQMQENRASVEGIRRMIDDVKVDLILFTSTWDDALPLLEMVGLFKHAAEVGVPTATLHLDTFWGKSRGGRQWWLNPMFHTAYIFTADGDYQKEWKLLGKNHIWLPPAVRHDAAHFGKFRQEYACDVAFVGSNGVGYHEDVWTYRKELVDSLRAMCRKNGWAFKNPGGDQPKIDRGEDMNDFYASAKVTVGDSLCLNYSNSKYWSDRVPEATGRGGLLIMPRIDELAKVWDQCLPMYRWGDFNDLEGMVTHYLNDEAHAKKMREEAQKVTANNHTYVNRVQTILDTVGLGGSK